jgi:hypothetical protein
LQDIDRNDTSGLGYHCHFSLKGAPRMIFYYRWNNAQRRDGASLIVVQILASKPLQ